MTSPGAVGRFLTGYDRQFVPSQLKADQLLDVFPIIFDARGLKKCRPDICFPRFSV